MPGATGGYNNKSSSRSVNVPAETTLRVNNKTNGGNNSPRKRKSPIQNNNDLQQVGDDNNEDAKMRGNISINLIIFLSGPERSCKIPPMGRLTTRGSLEVLGGAGQGFMAYKE